VSLSTGSVLLFFIGAAFGWWSVGWVWLFSIIAVAAASVWGWKNMDFELQIRLRAMATKVFMPTSP
jgi:hypothetical protein